ncbi:NfeD family protein [Halomonas sp. MCCC 1A17488]|uniref:NfeD family protein n=1 Tax=Billgrantia sulfidoxydans TaxID=2733484 RepID=A0ABX7W7Q4_9GAMM|nr:MULTISPECIES: NfeD family protein [Halomonas]MCE8017791.1 NfeD family protein [Halomonas sp. MCCC 1A17488]MCG3241124.1 NfeD family protein [Halomonas sp. MCCC 1A17488]QPP48980.1 NfeD family protein [Halomonas sp. SS10-MC5]QTP56296.1 NfeD family protein [Halomonas sulfidoxydans]
MDWNPALIWLAIALLLGLAELSSGGLVLLSLGVAAALTSALAALGFTLPWQLLAMGVFSGILIPLAIKVIRPWFSPSGVSYGTTGTGVEQGRTYTTLKRDFDGACGIKINGDFYRLRVAETGETELAEGTLVVFQQFDGTTAIVSHVQPH